MLTFSSSHYLYIILAFFCRNACGCIFAVAPEEYFAGWNYSVVVTACGNIRGLVNVQVIISQKENAIGQAHETFVAGETKKMDFLIPDLINVGHEVIVALEASGAVNYSMNKSIIYNANRSVVLVETDKAVYKPGQQVRIRVVNINKDLQPVFSPLTVTIMNPSDNKIEEYKDVNSVTGVVERSFQLSDYPALGRWTVLVTDSNGLKYSYGFTVEEFVLPRFSVEVKAEPGYVLLGSKKMNSAITVTAQYTYGKGVQGNCMLTLSTEEGIIKHMKELTELGSVVFTDLSWEDLIKERNTLQEYTITLTAEVTDVTGRTEAGKTTLMAFEHNIKVKILEHSTFVVRSGIKAYAFIRVSDHSGNPVGPVELLVEVKIPNVYTLPTTLMVSEGQTDVNFAYSSVFKSTDNHYSGTIKVTLMSNPKVSVTRTLNIYISQHGSGVMITPVNNQPIAVGERADFNVSHETDDINFTLAYVILGRGNIINYGQPINGIISIVPTFDLCPQGSLLVYMLAGNGQTEAVVDYIELKPTRCFGKKVGVKFDAAETHVGTDVSMHINIDRSDGSNAVPGVHNVYYLAVDKSITLMQGRTDLNGDRVLDSVSRVSSIGRANFQNNEKPTTTLEILRKLRLMPITDAHFEEPAYDEWLYNRYSLGRVSKNAVVRKSKLREGVVLDDLSAEMNSVVRKVRKDFPETWMWGHAKTDVNGHLTETVTLPDTITTWMVSAFAINEEGLAVGQYPFQLTAFQTFFLSMNLPYSVKRGEVFTLVVTVFNYRPQEIDAVVRLEKSNHFSISDSQETGGWYEKNVELQPNRASSVSFKIILTSIGHILFHVTAEDMKDGMKDEVKRKLLVKPEGEERSRAITKVLMSTSSSQLNHTFTLPWPTEKIVEDSRRVEVLITGDVFGQALSNLERLLVWPCGCGEQNMITTVPNIFGLAYIRETGLSMEDLEEQLIIRMKLGYQRQVDNYRHNDGSYSAWGEKQPSKGSTWLTAFVIKSFSQASKYITIDHVILTSGTEFLRSKQLTTGEFVENGMVIHSEMQQGTSTGSALTVYVLISMLEANHALRGSLLVLDTEILRATKYVMKTISLKTLKSERNIFLAALSGYALSLVPDRNPEMNTFITDMLDFILEQGAPWEERTERVLKKMAADNNNSADIANHVHMGITHSQPRGRDIEIASYCLLTLIKLGRFADSVKIMKWLQTQQNSLGGYGSTQDTVMALQALSEFGAKFRSKEAQGKVTVYEPGSGQTIDMDISDSRSVLLQTVELPGDTDTVQVTLTGPANSAAIVKVRYTYNTLAGEDDVSPQEPQLTIYTRTSKVKNNIHRVETCMKSSKTLKYNGMFVATLTLPSGERALDEAAVIKANNPKVSRVETSVEAIHFYLDEAPGDGCCLHAELEQQMEFEIQKPGSARIYAYYEPAIANEAALVLSDTSCVSDQCNTARTVMLNVANVLLTVCICTLFTLLLCI